VFNVDTVMDNTGTMVISDGAMLPLSGTINNTGTIELDGAGSGTDLQLIEHGVTLTGHGHVTLSDSSDNVINGTANDVVLTNVDNTISGAGHLGDGSMALVNDGDIIATGNNALEIDTGANIVVNLGTLEATGIGGLVVHSDVDNSGLLWANGGNVTVEGNVSGTGSAVISGSATLEFFAASTVNTSFDAGATGSLKLDHASDFTGTVSGFAAGDHLDLLDLVANSATVNYAANQAGTGGTLSVTDGAHTANIALLGQYTANDFTVGADTNGGTLVSVKDHLV
jgi:hypothetical protein